MKIILRLSKNLWSHAQNITLFVSRKPLSCNAASKLVLLFLKIKLVDGIKLPAFIQHENYMAL